MKKIEKIILAIVIIFSIYLMGEMLVSIYGRDNISEQIIKEKQELGY